MSTKISEELYFYIVIFGGFVQGSLILVFALYALVAAATGARRRVWRTFVRFVAFNVCLLLTGAPASALWAGVAYERWYFEGDPVVTYQPIFPFGQYVLDLQFGSYRGGLLNGASLVQIEALWWFLSLLVWATTLWLYRKLQSRLVLRRPVNFTGALPHAG